MGCYRSVYVQLECAACAAPYRAAVQFKTGDDYTLAAYDVGDVIDDLSPGSTWDGLANALCVYCSRRREIDMRSAEIEALACAVERCDVIVYFGTTARKQTRNIESQVVVIQRAAPVAPHELRCRKTECRRWWRDGIIVCTNGAVVDDWPNRRRDVFFAVRALGWPDRVSDYCRSIQVCIDAERRLRIAEL
jgi:hypothetical protein